MTQGRRRVTYRAEMYWPRNDTWNKYMSTVRKPNGEVASAEWVGASLDNITEAIRQWDPEGSREWRIIRRVTTWTETVHYLKSETPS